MISNCAPLASEYPKGASEAPLGIKAPLLWKKCVSFIYFIYLLYIFSFIWKKKGGGISAAKKKDLKILKPWFYVIWCQQRVFSREVSDLFPGSILGTLQTTHWKKERPEDVSWGPESIPGLRKLWPLCQIHLPPVLANKVLLAHTHTHAFTYFLQLHYAATARLSNCDGDHMLCKA